MDDSSAFILAAYARSVCSVLRLAEVTATSQRWGNLTPATGSSSQVEVDTLFLPNAS